MDDPFDLDRFVKAQAPVYAQVLSELGARAKAQPLDVVHLSADRGPGVERDGQKVCDFLKEEAYAFLDHEVLGPRLIECANLVVVINWKTINEILGAPDDLKFRSSMTLFRRVSDNPAFDLALRKFYHGVEDARTVELLAGGG